MWALNRMLSVVQTRERWYNRYAKCMDGFFLGVILWGLVPGREEDKGYENISHMRFFYPKGNVAHIRLFVFSL